MSAGEFLHVRSSAVTGELEVQHGLQSGLGIISWKTDQLDGYWHRLVSIRDVALTSGEAMAYVDGAPNGRGFADLEGTVAFEDHRWHLGDRDAGGHGFVSDIADVFASAR